MARGREYATRSLLVFQCDNAKAKPIGSGVVEAEHKSENAKPTDRQVGFVFPLCCNNKRLIQTITRLSGSQLVLEPLKLN